MGIQGKTEIREQKREMSIKCRRMNDSDIDQVIAIQNENLLGKVPNSELKGGFVQGEFTAAAFRSFDRDVAVIVAEEDGKVAGYLCTSQLELQPGQRIAQTHS